MTNGHDLNISFIKATNFKCFKELEFHASPRVNLIAGVNGSGKTSLLEALCVALGCFFIDMPKANNKRAIRKEEIRLEGGNYTKKTIVEASGTLTRNDTISELLHWSRSISSTFNNDSKHTKEIRERGDELANRFYNQEDRTRAPIIAFFSTQRLFKDASAGKYDPKLGRFNGYLNSLDEWGIKKHLTDWLKRSTSSRATRQIKEVDQTDNVLQNVETVVRNLLIHFLNQDANSNLKVYSDEITEELIINFNNNPLPINSYSDGYRNLLWLAIGLTWRASELNPWMDYETAITNAEGIVLIDEIDLHLHPKWQSMAIPFLQKTFPKIQFFITTHSPIVIGNFKDGTLYRLEKDSSIKKIDLVYGEDANQVLREVMDAYERPIEVKNLLEEYLLMMEKRQFNLPRFAELRKKLKDLYGENHPEILRTETLLSLFIFPDDAIHSES